jgi:hypothetical protein
MVISSKRKEGKNLIFILKNRQNKKKGEKWKFIPVYL